MIGEFMEVLDRHGRIALQVSGGRDSIACLYLMRPYLDRITVYWCNTGAAFPETLSIIAKLRELCPNFVEIDGNQQGVIEKYGMPSDIVPASNTPIGLMGAGSSAPLIQDRYSCCANTIMLPLHQRMIDDGITLIIRGQKTVDRLKSPVKSGETLQGIEYFFPIEGWTSKQVTDYLRKEGAPIARFYEVLSGTPDCMTCSAWWEEGTAKYLKRYHKPEYEEVQRRLAIINEAVSAHITNFNKEVNT
jgi:3'-phosphoadenosine 5'-phosphosulfate sulfotransferase (PAPS reductase)/FAD synthetase